MYKKLKRSTYVVVEEEQDDCVIVKHVVRHKKKKTHRQRGEMDKMDWISILNYPKHHHHKRQDERLRRQMNDNTDFITAINEVEQSIPNLTKEEIQYRAEQRQRYPSPQFLEQAYHHQDNYPDRIQRDDTIKLSCTNLMVLKTELQWLKMNDNNTIRPRCLVLDADSFGSTRRILESTIMNVSPHDITVVNPFHWKKMMKGMSHLFRVPPIYCNLFVTEALRCNESGRYVLIDLDYCNTFTGSESLYHSTPAQDIEDLFKFNHFERYAMLRLTFCLRGIKSSSQLVRDEYNSTISQCVCQIGAIYHHKVVNCSVTYYDNMTSFLFEISC